MKSLRLFWPLLSLARLPALAGVLLAGLLSGLAGLGLMGGAAWLVSHAALQPPLYTLSLAITFVRSCGIGRAAARYLERLLSHRLAFRCFEALQLRLYDRAAEMIPCKAGLAYQGRFLEQLIQGSTVLRDFYLRAFLPVSASLLLTLCLAAWFLPFSALAAGLLVILWLWHLALPLLLLPPGGEGGAAADYRRCLQDAAMGREALLLAGSWPQMEQRLREAALAWQREREMAAVRQDRCAWLLDLCRQLVFIALLALLSAGVYEGHIAGVDLPVLLLLALALFAEYQPLAQAVRQFKEARLVLEGFPSLAQSDGAVAPEMPFEPQAPLAQDAPLLSAEGLSFCYHDGLPVFAPLDFHLHAGEVLLVTGESGVGKTTLAHLLLGFWRQDGGRLTLFGEDTGKLSGEAMRRFFAASLQGCYVFSPSIRDNFRRLHPSLSEAAIWQALAAAQLADFVRRLPHGLDEPLGIDGCRLSGGQRNRLLTALALAGKAPLLLLDEPMHGLDREMAAALRRSLWQRVGQGGQTLILITHDADTMDLHGIRLELKSPNESCAPPRIGASLG